MTADSYLAEMEEIQTEVAQSLYDDEVAILNALAPNGVPFGMQDHVLNNNAQMGKYLLGFKGQVPAQQAWIQQRVQENADMLMSAGVPLYAAAANDTRVWEIAAEAAIYYSYKMEGLLAAHMKRNK